MPQHWPHTCLSDKPFVLETNASNQWLGAVLSQEQTDHNLYPVAYANRSLSPSEQNYGISELETLAVVWSISHFRSYLYRNCVTVLTDHTAVIPILETPNPSGKHARWWTKVYGSGVKEVHIRYRPGWDNAIADTLSHSPQAPAPKEGVGEGEVQVHCSCCDQYRGNWHHSVTTAVGTISSSHGQGALCYILEQRAVHGASEDSQPNSQVQVLKRNVFSCLDLWSK